MGRKNRRNKKEYCQGLGFNPNKYITKHTVKDGSDEKAVKANCRAEPKQGTSAAYQYTAHQNTTPQNTTPQNTTPQNDSEPLNSSELLNSSEPQKTPLFQKSPRRRDIWFAQLGEGDGHNGSIQDGVRPVFIISTDLANINSSTITVVPLTTKYKKPYLPAHTWVKNILAGSSEQREHILPSMVLGEQITTIKKSSLRNYAGTVQDDRIVEAIERAVMAHLNLTADSSVSCGSTPRTSTKHIHGSERSLRSEHSLRSDRDFRPERSPGEKQ